MDTLVARYSRPTFQQNESFADDDPEELMGPTPPLSLKFAMPPVAQVHITPYRPVLPARRAGLARGSADIPIPL